MTVRPVWHLTPFTRKLLTSVLLIVVFLAGGGGAYKYLVSLKKPPESRAQKAKVYNVEIFDVEESELREILSAFGTAHANREVVLSAQIAGEIVDVHPTLKVGQQVEADEVSVGPSGESVRTKGDLLVEIDKKPFQERVAQANNRIAESGAELARLKQEELNNEKMLKKVTEDYKTFTEEYERVRKLHKDGVGTLSEVSRALLELRQYEDAKIRHTNEKDLFPTRREKIIKQQETFRTDLKVADLDLDHTDVRPPFSGKLSEVMVELGQYVRAGEPLVRLTDDSEVEIPLPLTLTDYAKIARLVSAKKYPRVELSGHGTDKKHQWVGYVVRVAPEADELTRTIKVYVHVENKEQDVPLLPGTFVHARIFGPMLEHAIVVPRDAIRNGRVFIATKLKTVPALTNPKPSSGKTSSSILEGLVEVRRVEIEQFLETLAIIRVAPRADVNVELKPGEKFGLKPGEKIIMTNLDTLQAGARIRIQSSRRLADELKGRRTRFALPELAGGGSNGGKDAVN